MERTARRLHRLVEPIHVVTYFADEPTDALMALGHRNYWDGYFAGRAAPLGGVPAEVVHAIFYNFADSRSRACRRPRHQGGDQRSDRRTDPLRRAPGAPRTRGTRGRALARGHPAREHRGDGHIAALVAAGIGGTEAHVLHALSEDIPAEKFGRVHHLPAARLAAVGNGMRGSGLIDGSGWLSDAGRLTKERIESLTDDLAMPAYDGLEPGDLDQLIVDLEPISAALDATGSR